MATNRYSQLSFGDLRQLPLLQLPYEQLDSLLGQQQFQISATKALADKAPKYIPDSAYATQTAKQINEYQESLKKQLVDIAAKGNTRDYMAALDQTQQEIAKLYRPGGVAYNLEQDYAAYQDFVTKQKERLAKREIEPEQFQASIKEPLQEYDAAAGIKRYNPTPRPQAVNFDEFANKFISNYEDTDLIKRGNFRSINGRWVYDDTKVTGVEAQRVLNDLTNAFANAAATTGQLQDRFNVLNENGDLTTKYKSTQLQQASGLLDLINKTDLTKKSSIEDLQKQLNELGLDTGGVDGKAGPKTKAAIELAKKSAQATIETLNQTDVSQLTPEAQKDFYSNYVKSLATPYANATARQKEERKFTNFGEQLWWLKEKADLENKSKQEAEGVFRLEGQSIGFNPDVLPKDINSLEEATNSTTQQISKLQEELKTTNDPQRQQYILSQIKWQDAIKQKQENLMTQAREASKPAGYDQFMQQYGFDKMTPQQFIDFTMGVESKSGGDIVNQVLTRGGKPVTIKEAQNVLRQYKEFKADKTDAQNKWLKENADNTNFQLGTISLAPEERTAIKASLNTDSWTFFDEKGVILNEEKGSLFGTEKKPIISDNVEVGGITKHPFGDFGNLVTLTDNKGKVYYASMNNGNVGKAIGNTIKNKAPEGSDQWLLGEMISNPNIANTLGQMTDMKYGDTRTIVSGTNSLGKINKKKEESGNTVYLYTAPDGVVLDKQGSKTKEFNNVTDLALSMEAVNTALSTQKSK